MVPIEKLNVKLQETKDELLRMQKLSVYEANNRANTEILLSIKDTINDLHGQVKALNWVINN